MFYVGMHLITFLLSMRRAAFGEMNEFTNVPIGSSEIRNKIREKVLSYFIGFVNLFCILHAL